MRHYRVIGRVIEHKPPTLAFLLCCANGRSLQDRFGQALEPAFVFDMYMPRLGRVLHILVKERLRHSELLHRVAELGFVFFGQRDARESKGTQSMFEDSTLGSRCIGRQCCRYSFECFLQASVL